MSFTHILNVGYSSGSDSVVASDSQTSGGEVNVDESIANGATNLEVVWSFDVTAAKMLIITSDQEITIKTNANGTPPPDQTLTVGPTSGFIVWSAKTGTINPITDDVVTNLFITNASGTAANLKIRSLQDVTP